MVITTSLIAVCFIGKTVDYGYALPKIYNYTFHPGSISAYPDANITISGDMIKDNEAFQMVIIDTVLPYNVEAGHPATIIMNDKGSKYNKMHSY